MAAGLSIDPQNIPEFRQRLSQAILAQVGDTPLEQPLWIDGYLPLADLSLDLVKDLERLAPFGPGNPSLTLATLNIGLVRHRAIGKDGEHLLMTVEDAQGAQKEIIWWQGAGWDIPEGRFDLAYTVHAATYRGELSVQITWIDARSNQAFPEAIAVTQRQLLDYRQDPSPLSRLEALRQEGDLQIWREGLAHRNIPGQIRSELAPAKTLVVWTIPPGRDELQQAIEQVQPQRLVLFANDPGNNHPKDFLQQLVGLVKHVLQTPSKTTSLQELAAATAQRLSVVRVGLEWLQARGLLSFDKVEHLGGARLQLAPPSQGNLKDAAPILEQLQLLMDETRSYRSYYRRSFPEKLV
jgi:single-stranded-DNA-specific exonuclease